MEQFDVGKKDFLKLWAVSTVRKAFQSKLLEVTLKSSVKKKSSVNDQKHPINYCE